MKQNLAEPLSLEELGKKIGCSHFYLSRIFSAQTGHTITQHLRQLRMERAAELLKSGEHNVTEAALEADADDVVTHEDGSIDVFTSFTSFYAVRNALEAAGFKGDDAEIVMQPTTSAELDLEGAEKVLKLIDMLEDLDDVQNVYSNADIPEDVAAQLG